MSASPDAQLRIEKALRHIQEAQARLSCALAELSTLRNIGPEWTRGQKLYDAVRAYWYRVGAAAEKRGFITTDSEPAP